MKKSALIFALIIGLLTSASTLQAQVNTSRYITLTVGNGQAIKFDFNAAAAGTPVRIVSGSNIQNITVGTDWYNGNFPSTFTVTADGTEMKVYGDIIGFDCSGNGANLIALDLSHNTQLNWLYCSDNNLTTLDVSKNTQLNWLDYSNNNLTSIDLSKNTRLTYLYCWGNNFTTAALDAIYCALPVRSASNGDKIFPLHESSSVAEQNMVASTNAANATSKNWQVLKFKEDKNHTTITTTGSYVCSGGGPTTYDLKIAGVDVTSANCSNLSVISGVSGTVKYDPTTKVLTLDGATIQKTDNTVAIESNIDGLTIKVIGTNNLTTGNNVVFYFIKPLTITGGGVLNANSGNSYAIYARETNLTIDGCTVNAKGKYGIAGNYGLSETLTIKNSTVTAEGIYGSIIAFASLTLDGCAITQPAGAAFDASQNAVALGREVVKSKVVISPVTTYDLKIAGVQVTSANCSNLSVISGVSGTVKYDPTNKVLTLDGATIQINTSNAIDSRIDGLTIKVIGTNNLTTGGNAALGFSKPLTITGGGVLNANSGEDCGIYVNETNLTIDGCTVNAKGKYGIAGKDGSSEMLTIKNSTVTAEGTAGSITDFASLTLDGCAITQPAGAAFDASLHAVALGGAVVKSKVVIGGNPNMSRYITLTVKSGENIRLDLKAAAEGTPVRIVSGSNTQNIRVGTSWTGFSSYTADGTEMTVYGDLTGFDCSRNGANLIALEVSHNTLLKKLYCQGNDLRNLDISRNTHLIDLNCRDNKLSSLDVSNNTQLEELYCHNNNFTTAALDNIYCALPDRTGKTNGKILPIYNSSSANHATVLATNKANATAKNWKVQYYDGGADVPTTGSYDCSTAVAEAAAEQALTLYPNPVADMLYLSATARTIRIYDIYGTEVAHAYDTDSVEVSHLPAGIYTVRADGTVAKMVKR